MHRYSAVAALLLLAACGGERSGPQASIPSATRVSPPYTPPSDGRLTEKQVGEFLQISGRVPRPASPAGDPLASAFRMNPDEYLWVRLKILEARIAIEDAEARRRNVETYRKTIASLKSVASVSKDPPTRDSLNRQAGELERELAEAERLLRKPPLPADAFNQALVARRQREIEAASSRLLEPPR